VPEGVADDTEDHDGDEELREWSEFHDRLTANG
jgi:hypothetical protein